MNENVPLLLLGVIFATLVGVVAYSVGYDQGIAQCMDQLLVD